jgi:pimeloyl-ACP methyl ester carboxylesterase
MALTKADDTQQHTQSSRGSSFFRLKSNNLKLKSKETDENAKGSLGLNLLYCPTNPVADFVFVHGLGGGSRRTWSKSSNLEHFWPRWLPQAPDFKDVRIHSFGYNSDWASMRQDMSNISDFALLLLNTLQYTDTIWHPSGVPIVFIVHSMGGLVAKKACLLAQQDAAFQDLASRFRTVVFLATPHRGSDGAHVINSVLRLSFAHAPRQYIEDLERNSATLQSINEDFRHLADKLELYSFFETMKTAFLIGGIGNVMIVDKSSATLGYPRERRFPIQANHRGICKFDERTDPNYLLIKSVLASIVRARGEESRCSVSPETRCDRANIVCKIHRTDTGT